MPITCNNCHGEISSTTRYCPHCGTAVVTPQPPVAETPSSRTCASCGADLMANARFCDACGKPIDPSTPPFQGRQSIPGNRRLKTTIYVGLGIIFVVAIGLIGYTFFFHTPPIEALLPERVPVMAMGDAAWVWDNFKEVKDAPQIKQALDDMEKETHISIERDVAPWVGQVGFAMLSTDQRHPQGAFFAEVKNPKAALDAVKRFQDAFEKETHQRVTSSEYHGVKLQVTQTDESSDSVPVKVAWLANWAVIGFGDGAIEKIIDTWQGREKSLQSTPEWSSIKSKLSGRPVFWYAGNARELQNVMGTSSYGRPEYSTEMMPSLVYAGLTETNDSLQLQVVGSGFSDSTKVNIHDFKARIQPVTGDSLKQLPEGAICALMISNPTEWLTEIRKDARDSCKNSYDREDVDRFFRDYLDPIGDAARSAKGECCAALVYKPGRGFAVEVLAETDNESDAKAASDDLRKFFERTGRVEQSGNNTRVIMDSGADDRWWPLKQAFTTRGNWLVYTTNEEWLSDTTHANLQLTGDLKNCDIALVGGLGFLTDMWPEIEKNATTQEDRDMLKIVRDLKVEKGQVSLGYTMDSKGDWSAMTFQIQSIQWKTLIKQSVKTLASQPERRYDEQSVPAVPSPYGSSGGTYAPPNTSPYGSSDGTYAPPNTSPYGSSGGTYTPPPANPYSPPAGTPAPSAK